jgi:CTP:molybdopterin cytidylyltransferase MocA
MQEAAVIFAIAAHRCILHRLTRLPSKPEEPRGARAGRIAGIVLAAGGSSRFGSPKQLLTHHGENLVRRAARAALESGLDPVIVVLGAYRESVEIFVAGLEPLVIINNDAWETGQASSLRAGISQAMTSGCDGALVMLADQPLVDTLSLSSLVERFGRDNRVVASRYSGVIGAPAVFGSEYFDRLLALIGDHGAGQWLRSNADLVTAVDLDEAAVDVDTPDDLKHLPT